MKRISVIAAFLFLSASVFAFDGGEFGSVRDYLKKTNTSVVPAANGTYTLGTSSKLWDTLFSENMVMYPGTQTGITISSAVVVTNSFMVVSASGSLTSVATPFMSTTTPTAGTIVILMGGSANVLTVKDNDTLSGSQLELGAATRALGLGDVLGLIYYSTKWYELFFANN